jgi:hypothetical protein
MQATARRLSVVSATSTPRRRLIRDVRPTSKLKMQTCYSCNQPATSREHVPAKSFFPEDQREQLITVDSCQLHNEDTSKDDDYVRNMIVVMAGGASDVAYSLLEGKVKKSFTRSPKLAAASLGSLRVASGDSQPFAKIIEIDRQRFDAVMTKIYRGLAANTGDRMTSTVNVLYRDFVYEDTTKAEDSDPTSQFAEMNIP